MPAVYGVGEYDVGNCVLPAGQPGKPEAEEGADAEGGGHSPNKAGARTLDLTLEAAYFQGRCSACLAMMRPDAL